MTDPFFSVRGTACKAPGGSETPLRHTDATNAAATPASPLKGLEARRGHRRCRHAPRRSLLPLLRRPAVLGPLWNRRPLVGHSEGVTVSQDDACLSSIASSMARASPRASAIAVAADTVLAVPMIGATAMRVPWASSSVRSVPRLRRRHVQQIRRRGSVDSCQGSEADDHELTVAQARAAHRGLGHLENCVEKWSVFTHLSLPFFWEFQIDETARRHNDGVALSRWQRLDQLSSSPFPEPPGRCPWRSRRAPWPRASQP